MVRTFLHTRWWRDLLVIALAAAFDLNAYGGDRAWRWGSEAPVWLVPAATAILSAALLLRWRYPITLFLAHWFYALAGLLMPLYAPIAGLLVALHALACRVRPDVSLPLTGLTVIPFAVNGVNTAASNGRNGLAVAALTAAWIIVSAAVWAVGHRTFTADRRAVLLQELQAHKAAEAVRAERVRLARDLHDIVAGAVSAMLLQAGGARVLLAPSDEVHRALVSIETAGVQAMEELHRMLGLLRAVGPDVDDGDITTQPGLADVPALVEQARGAGLDVDNLVDGTPSPLDRSVELAVYRVAQEAVTNAMKHSGSGSHLRLHQVWSRDRLTLTARSTPGLAGHRPEVPSSGVGITGLTERVVLVGGRLEAGSSGEAFLLRADFPIGRFALNTLPPDAP